MPRSIPAHPKQQWGGRRPGAGRPPKPISERAAHQGSRVRISLSLEAARQLAELMLRDVPGVHTPEEMIEHLIAAASMRQED